MQGDRAHGTAYPGRLADRGRPCADLDRPHGSRRRRPSVNKQLVAELTRCEYIDPKLDLLVLDELSYVPASKVGAELLFDVISTAYERTSMIVTTNLPFESWTEVLGSERLTGATLDRLTHRCRIIETKGESYRLHDAKKRNQPRPNPDAVTLPTSSDDEIFTGTTPNQAG